MADRVIRTLKNKVNKHFSVTGSCIWIELLSKLTSNYNNTVRRTIIQILLYAIRSPIQIEHD